MGDWLVPLFYAAIISALIFNITSVWGIGISPDSRTYANWASKICKEGFVAFLTTHPDGTFPFLYPTLLAAGLWIFNGNFDSAAVALNVACCCASSLMLYRFAKRSIASVFFMHLTVVYTLFSFTLFNLVWTMAWSEPLFIALSLGVLTLLSEERLSQRRELLAGCLIVLAFSTRYVGVTLIATAFLLSFRADGEKRFCVDWKRALWTCFVPALCFGLLVLRNWFVASTLMGPRSASNYTFAQNVFLALRTFYDWFCLVNPHWIPLIGHRLPSNAALNLIEFGVFAAVVALWVKRGRWGKANSVVRTHTVFLIVFVSFMVVTSTTTHYDALGARLLSPVMPSAVFLFCSLLSWIERKMSRKTSLLFLGAVGLCAANVCAGSVRTNMNQLHSGVWSRNEEHRDADLRAYLDEIDGYGAIYVQNWQFDMDPALGVRMLIGSKDLEYEESGAKVVVCVDTTGQQAIREANASLPKSRILRPVHCFKTACVWEIGDVGLDAGPQESTITAEE